MILPKERQKPCACSGTFQPLGQLGLCLCLVEAKETWTVCPTGATAHQHHIQPVPAVPEDRQSQIALGHREQEHGKSVCAELLQCWGIAAAAAWPGQICHTLSLQLQREIFTAARAAAEILSRSGGKNLKNAAASISRGRCSTGIFCCPSQFYSHCFGL